MNKNEIAYALALSMKRSGYELNGTDRMIIRSTISGTIAARRKLESYTRSAVSAFAWKRPQNRRQH